MAPLPKPSEFDSNNSSCPPPWCPPPSDDHQSPPSPYPYPVPPTPHGRSTFVTALIIAIPVLAFLALSLSVLIFVRRRRLRQRREALLEAALAPAAPATDDGDGPGGEGEQVVHHAWHIRTVGLEDAAIESIALTRYERGAGAGDDCTVCLGEFQDGELLRLLPKCAHAFHVQCIDTWLRAHVTCPLCRADVIMDPAADAADASTEQSATASNTRAMELELPDQQANEQQQELRVQTDQPQPQPHHSSSMERPRRQQIRHPGARARNFRRVASMDSPSPPTASAEEAPGDEQAGAEKQGMGLGGAVCCEVSPEPGHQLNRPGPAMKRSLSASSRWTLLPRHRRARSSLLPL